MGYRSDVAFVVKFDTVENRDAYVKRWLASDLVKVAERGNRSILDDFTGSLQVELNNPVIVFDASYLKWYEDYEDVIALTACYENSQDAKGFQWYLFKRLGENDDDYEEHWAEAEGCNCEWGTIDTVRKLEVNL